MHPEQIKADLRMKGFTAAALADKLGLSSSTISQVINGRGVSTRVRNAVAEITGHSVDTLWPPKKTTGLRRAKVKTATAPIAP